MWLGAGSEVWRCGHRFTNNFSSTQSSINPFIWVMVMLPEQLDFTILNYCCGLTRLHIWTYFFHGLGYPIKVTSKIWSFWATGIPIYMWWSSVVRNLLPFLSPSISEKSMMSDTTFWLVWYNLLIQTGSNSSKQTWFLVSWLQHSKLNWFELTGKGQMKYLSTG